jgi:hypothetical protein
VTSIELMAEQARIRLHHRINRSAGQHKRAIAQLAKLANLFARLRP